MRTVENAAERIQALILNAEMPKDIEHAILRRYKKFKAKYVAVRSSATAEDSASAAWAGQLDTFLNTPENNVLENVQKCWASLFTPRAIFYRFEKELHKKEINVAVVIQKMVKSEVSGVGFSVHPVTRDRNQLIIEAGFGLGEAIVSGQITPDSYVVEKDGWRILNVNVSTQTKALYGNEDGGNTWRELSETEGSKQVLKEKEIIELSKLIVKIEKHYGFPVDVEWAMEKNRFYITQSRPITTLISEEQNTPIARRSSDYVRMFEATGMPLLINTIAFEYYKDLEVMAIFRNNVWTTYFPKKHEEKTLREGLELYGSNESFANWKKEFKEYKKRSNNILENLIKKKRITCDELKESFKTIAEHWKYYKKTEFFYVDEAFNRSEKNKVIKDNLIELKEIKNWGRLRLNKLIFGEESYLSKIISIISKQFGIKTEEIFFYTAEEVEELYKKKKVKERELKDRKDYYAYFMEKGKAKILQGDDAKEFIKEFIIDNPSWEIKGKVANHGVARGKAKVIGFGYEDFDAINEKINSMDKGDILIAETTSPEIMSACKKAAAIVTNQGGMLSHAAIVSRELGIPCIVGTENAVEMINDGDFVEVNADKGIVKIVKKVKRE